MSSFSSIKDRDPIVIVGAARTPVGAFNGGFADIPAHSLGSTAIRAALERAKVSPTDVDEVILGQVLTAGGGQNPARQAAMDAGCPKETTAFLVNQLCGSGLRAIALGAQQIAAGDVTIVVAGGQESMSMAQHCAHLRGGIKMGNAILTDSMLTDGLIDAFLGYHMGVTAENIARDRCISREEQDAFAVASQNKAEAAQMAGRFRDEIVPVTIHGRKGEIIVEADEFIRPGTTLEGLARLRPPFKTDGTVTAGNASGINDGAAAVVLMRQSEAKRRGVAPLARIVSWATSGVDPAFMGLGPVPATRRALEKAGWTVSDLDLVEANEAFAAQSCAIIRDLNLDPSIVNVNGGAIAIGHPIGASGTRIFVTLLSELVRRDARRGLATLCIGGGMGITVCVARD